MKIAVIGTGYVGLVTGTCLAEVGNMVSCVDIDTAKVAKMRAGEVPIYEPGLEELFKRNIAEGRLSFTTDLAKGVAEAEVIFLALPTPPGEDGSADLSYVLGVAEDLGKLLKRYAVVVDKSTVPVGTADRVRAKLQKHGANKVDVVSNPEFLREGFAVSDFMNPDRIVVGCSSDEARKVMEELYHPFVSTGSLLLFMDERSAEMTKYAANSFLAAKISFMNEVANLCELVDADVDAIRLGIGADERIGKRFLFPGIGYGGSCFPKDVQALSHTAASAGYDFKILGAVHEINKRQKQRLVEKVQRHYGGELKGKRLALWGLAFKPETDDIREAPALEMIAALTGAGATVVGFDPEARANVEKLLSDKNRRVQFADTMYDALKDADALLIATEWKEFYTPDFAQMKALLKRPVVFDGRNIFELETMREHGFHYESIGRRTVSKKG